MCQDYRSRPGEGFSTNWNLEGLKGLLKKKGLPNFNQPDEWMAFFADKQQLAKENEFFHSSLFSGASSFFFIKLPVF